MRHPILKILAAALMASAVAVPASAETAKIAGPGKVAVHHGAKVEIVPARPKGVLIQRGAGAEQATLSELDELRGIAAKADQLRVVAGEDQIWFVDRKRNRLINCRFRITSTVGRDEIRCLKRRLPK